MGRGPTVYAVHTVYADDVGVAEECQTPGGRQPAAEVDAKCQSL